MTFRNSTTMRLRRAYMTMHRYAQSYFSQFGVTADQYVLLSALAEENGVTQRELANATCSDANTIGAMLRLLEKKGLIRRREDQTDGRARIVLLSAKGRKLQQRLAASVEPVHTAMRTAVGEENWDQLGQSLSRIEGAMRQLAERSAIAG